ncbi:hypothetical protein TGPRC2_236230 [Toxoplasma gondii TgCatPRC2]|uniref:Uncharacterized protein n=2 Tax=Toxoplasma gondii TaxID=5811 RepID=A0A151H4D7_TOXGO|nr:hypothetical protein TGARI_236230 [Toxoplasma gondii ARI]KYK64206.1 hypothetical protein TGPRC2_236230 [Toxoplasma gondii TgCatPRC2]
MLRRLRVAEILREEQRAARKRQCLAAASCLHAEGRAEAPGGPEKERKRLRPFSEEAKVERKTRKVGKRREIAVDSRQFRSISCELPDSFASEVADERTRENAAFLWSTEAESAILGDSTRSNWPSEPFESQVKGHNQVLFADNKSRVTISSRPASARPAASEHDMRAILT